MKCRSNWRVGVSEVRRADAWNDAYISIVLSVPWSISVKLLDEALFSPFPLSAPNTGYIFQRLSSGAHTDTWASCRQIIYNCQATSHTLITIRFGPMFVLPIPSFPCLWGAPSGPCCITIATSTTWQPPMICAYPGTNSRLVQSVLYIPISIFRN